MISHASIILALASSAMPDSIVHPQQLGEAHVAVHRNANLQSSAPLQIVSASDISRRGVVSLTEVLNTFAGVSVKDYGGIGGLKTVSLRSFGTQHTGISYDGIAMTDAANGQVDIGRFNLDNVHSLRVDIAGTDDIFRPAKLASYVGVVSLESDARPQHDEAQHTVSLRYASYNTVNPYVHFRHAAGKRWHLGAWANYVHSEGDYPFRLKNGSLVTDEVRLNSQVGQCNGEAYAAGELGRLGSLRFKANGYYSTRGLPGNVVLYTQHPTEHLWDLHFSASAQHRGEWGKWRMQTNLSYANVWNRYTDSDPKYVVPEDDRYILQTSSFSSVVLWQTMENLSFSLAEDLDYIHLDSNIPESVQPTRESSHTAFSAKFATSRFTAVGTLLGLVNWEQAESAAGAPPIPSTVRTRLTPTLSVACKVLSQDPSTSSGTDLRLRASYKESYRLPSFTDMYYLRVGNRNLHPERASQMNVGATWQHNFGRHTLSVTADAYYNNVRDKIVAVPTMFIWHMRNVGRVRMQGLDVTASYRSVLSSYLTVHADANYCYQHAIDITNTEAKNYRHQIPYAPRHTGNAALSAVFPWFTASYTLVAVGARYSLAQNTPAYRIEPYADHSVSLNRTFDFHRCHLHLSAEALNLAGRNYEIIKYYPMPGRNFRFTAKVKF